MTSLASVSALTELSHYQSDRKIAVSPQTLNKNNDSQVSVKVNISLGAKTVLTEENKVSTSEVLHKRQSNTTPSENSEADTNSEQLIKELQEKIRELMTTLTALKTKKDSDSQQKAQLMEAELMSLNAQLMSLLNEKMKSQDK